jgi:hypothetical protein
MKGIKKRMLDWCPQPRQPIQNGVTRLSNPIIMSFLVIETIALLILPLSYYVFLAPKPDSLTGIYASEYQYPLSNSQIAESWPNLPTAKEITEAGYCYSVHGQSNWTAYVSPNSTISYSVVDLTNWDILANSTSAHVNLMMKAGPLRFTIENCTEVNPFLFANHEGIPIVYRIWLQYNSTIWIEVPHSLLTSTSNPPQPPTEQNTGFLNTNLPTSYVIFATLLIGATALASMGYVASTRRKRVFQTST